VEAFERELAAYCGVPLAVGVANGTEAIELALQAGGVGPGDEVVTSSLSAAFTALAVLRVGARPVFADVDATTLNVSAETIARVLSPRTKALLPVHLYGQSADMDPILDLARERKLLVVEDACQAVGARYHERPVGSLAPMAALSFYPTKNLGGIGDGGAILVQDASYLERLRRLRNGGQTDRYRHELPGMNSRLDELQAAILRVKLQKLDAWTTRRRELAVIYTRELQNTASLQLPVEPPYARAVHHLYVVRHPRRDALAEHLKARGIATLIHYPIPLHRQPAFAGVVAADTSLPNVEAATREILSLPLYPELRDEQAVEVARAVRDF
jgi:dTDP-4-amino-4,6-dideoxygalactose transaminase